MSVNGNQLPPVMPATVPRITLPDGTDGLATKFLLDWEQATSAFYTASLNDLQTQTNTVSANLGIVSANLTTEITARVNADTAFAAQITTLNAQYGSISANGQIYIATVANPGGATAAYGVFLTAGNAFTGLTMIADSGGGSSVAIAASQFTFTDSGTATQVFSYSGGVFTFFVPVVIRNQDIGTNAVSNSAGNAGTGSVSQAITVRSGARVSIIATFDGDATLYNTLSTYTLTIKNNAGTIIKTVQVGYFASGSGSSTVQRYFACTALAFDMPSAGSNTYTAQLNLISGSNNPLIAGPISILVTELSK